MILSKILEQYFTPEWLLSVQNFNPKCVTYISKPNVAVFSNKISRIKSNI